MIKFPGTENCIICGKKSTGHAGHVIAKMRMALGNLVDTKISAGWCDEHTKIIDGVAHHLDKLGNVNGGNANGCYGLYDNSFMGGVVSVF